MSFTNTYRNLLCTIFSLLLASGYAQPDTLSLKTAIDSALKNNFDILLATDNYIKNKTGNTLGMAGGLPQLSIDAANYNSISTVHQEYQTGTVVDETGVSSTGINGALTLSYTLFNGFKVIATRQQLEALESKSEIGLNAQIQNTVAAVMMEYFNIIRQEQYLQILNTSKKIAQQKLTIIETRRKVGLSNDAEYLQAQIDLASADQQISSQQVIIEATKTNLQVLIGNKSFHAITLSDSINIDTTVQLDYISGKLANNPNYLALDQQIKISESTIKQINSLRYPSLGIYGSYGASYLNNETGNILINRELGPEFGATLRIPLFNGFKYKTQRDMARIDLHSVQLEKEQTLVNLQAQTAILYNQYSNNLSQLAIQQDKHQKAERLMKIALQRFQNNLSTILELQAAQLSFENSAYQLVNLQYAAKLSEIELKRLIFEVKW